MASHALESHIPLGAVINFRDLGGYRIQDGHTIKWRAVYRSGELQHATEDDVSHLTETVGLATVLDLRSTEELGLRGIGPLQNTGVRHHHVPFSGNSSATREGLRKSTYMGEFYLWLLEQPGFGTRVLEALELIAESGSHPLVFHCTAGKDRTGVLAGLLLGILGVSDVEIIENYATSDATMKALIVRIAADPERAERSKENPDFAYRAVPESMRLFLSFLQREYGSVRGYVEVQGGNSRLFKQLEVAYGEAWAPPLGWGLFVFTQFFYVYIGISFALAAVYAVPG